MSFSSDAKGEVMRTSPVTEEEMRSELTAAVLLTGLMTYRGRGRLQLTLSYESASVTRYFYAQVRRLMPALKPQLQTVRSSQLGDHTRYRFELTEEETDALITGLGLRDESAFLGVRREPDQSILRGEAALFAYLRGAFLAAGWVSDPERAYCLEFALGDEAGAEQVRGILSGMGFKCGLSARKSQTVAYLRDFEGVSRLLASLGAHAAYMAYENVRIMKDLRGSVNRQTNCDDSNTDKTVSAAQKQIRDIRLLIERGVMETLPQTLRAIAQQRLNAPDANLTELGQALDPPIGKSGANNRLRRLSALADDLRARTGDDPQ